MFNPNSNKCIDDSLTPTHMARPLRPQSSQVEVMKFWTDILPSAMSQLSEIPEPKDRNKSSYSIRNLSDWKDVEDKLRLARNHYGSANKEEDTSPGLRVAVRQKTRKILDRSAVPLEQATKFIPEVSVASPIVGAVKVLIAAYIHAAAVREELSTEFDDMGDGFSTIDFYVTMFPDDQNIVEAAENVVLAVLKAVEQTIGFYIGYHIIRVGSAIFRGSEYQRKLRDRLSEVKSCINELDRHGERSHKYQNSHAHQQNQEEHKITQNSIQSEATNNVYGLIQLNAQLQDIKQQLSSQSPSCKSKPMRPMLPQVKSPAEIWDALQIPEIDHIDLEYVMKKAESLPSEDRGRAEQVVNTGRFKQWMLSNNHWIYSGNERVRDSQKLDNSGRTMKLLVHGDYDSNDKISPLSVLCASLMEVLRSRENFISLVFFCGRHLDGDENPGPLAMIRSLASQLLQQNATCPSGLAQHVSMHGVRRGNIRELCKLFGCLIRQLPSTVTVFCMIDGIKLYEREQYRAGMEEILIFILDLAENEEQGVDTPIKLFLTSPQPTRYVREVFEDGTSLLTMASVPDIGQGPSSVRFKRQVNDMVQ